MKDISRLMAAAMKLIADQNKLKEVEPAGWEADLASSTGAGIYRFHAVPKGQSNGPIYDVVIDDEGSIVDLKTLAKREKGPLFPAMLRPGAVELNPPVETAHFRPVAASAVPVTINPSTNDMHLEPGQTFAEDIHVLIPAMPTSDFDVYFLADTTGSMSGIIDAVKAGASSVITQLHLNYPNMAFGVGNYKDFCSGDPYCFQHQQSPTTNPGLVQTAINAWNANGGSDTPEGQLYALDQIATAATIGWRPGAQRIIVWFGDNPGHDPICAGLPGVSTAINQAIVTNHLTAGPSPIKVVAISAYGDGLNNASATGDYPCPNTGSPGQGTQIALLTGGSYTNGVNPSTICSTIIAMVEAATNSFNNIHLAAAGGTAPFTTSITPAAGYGPVSGKESHDYVFRVVFTGPPCKNTDQVYTGTIDVIGDGLIVAKKTVRITVHACERWSYAVKFICGYVKEGPPGVVPLTAAPTLRPGIYATEVNILNYLDVPITVHKYLYPLMEHGEAAGREPHSVTRRLEDVITLREHTATFDDCQRLHELMHKVPGDEPLSIGWLELVSPVELHVAAVYTANDLRGISTDVNVVPVQGKMIKK